MKLKVIFFLALLFGIDVLTKIFALDHVPMLGSKALGYPFGGIGVFDAGPITFSLNLVTNTGAAWGLFQGQPGLLFAVRGFIILGLIIYTLLSHHTFSRSWPFWLIIGGAIGNGIDYVSYGYVIDFFHFTFWGHSFAIFNFADSYISIGVLLLILLPKYFSEKP